MIDDVPGLGLASLPDFEDLKATRKGSQELLRGLAAHSAT